MIPSLFSLLLLASTAEATPKVKRAWIFEDADQNDHVAVATVSGRSVSLVRGSVTSDAGVEQVTLAPLGLQLHGGAVLGGFPATISALTLTVYDAANLPVASFFGRITPEGVVTIFDPLPCEMRVCPPVLDLDVLSVQPYANPTGRYDLTLDLGGADVLSAASADFMITEARVETVCDPVTGVCEDVDTTLVTQSTVTWDTLDQLWEAPLALAPEGQVDVFAQTRGLDTNGRPVSSTATMTLGVPWSDEADGVNTLALDGDPRTQVALHRHQRAQLRFGEAHDDFEMGADGWSRVGQIPTRAQVRFDNARAPVTLPVNSYQVTRTEALAPEWSALLPDLGGGSLRVIIDGGNLQINGSSTLSISDLSNTSVRNTSLSLRPNGAGWEIAVTGYAAALADLPTGSEIGLTLVDAGGTDVLSQVFNAPYDDMVAVYFAAELELGADPVGLGLTGTVSLLGARGQVLSSGAFYGRYAVDAQGELELAAGPKKRVTTGSVIVGGAPVPLSTIDPVTGEVVSVPPVILRMNGTGTRRASASSSQTQQTQLL